MNIAFPVSICYFPFAVQVKYMAFKEVVISVNVSVRMPEYHRRGGVTQR